MAGIGDIITSSLEGNALEVQDTVNDLMQQKVAAAIQQLRGEISSSVFGSYAGEQEEQDTESESDVQFDEDDVQLDDSYNDSSLEDLLQGLEDTNG